MYHDEKPKHGLDMSSETLSPLTGRTRGLMGTVYYAPWWLVTLVLLWIYVIYQMQFNPDYGDAFVALRTGTMLTLWLAVTSYTIALIIGLLVGIIRAYPADRPETRLPFSGRVLRIARVVLYHAVTVFVEFMRGIPPLVFLLIAWLIILPIVSGPALGLLNNIVLPGYRLFEPDAVPFRWRGLDPATAIMGLSLVYSAFLSEVFRAGIQSVDKGQIEAAKSLGMTFPQTMRYIVIPQAVRAVLPPLGNNFISMIKDTSLASILGTSEITLLARRWSGSQFTYVETYAVLSLMYLTVTVLGSLLVQVMEARLQNRDTGFSFRLFARAFALALVAIAILAALSFVAGALRDVWWGMRCDAGVLAACKLVMK